MASSKAVAIRREKVIRELRDLYPAFRDVRYVNDPALQDVLILEECLRAGRAQIAYYRNQASGLRAQLNFTEDPDNAVVPADDSEDDEDSEDSEAS